MTTPEIPDFDNMTDDEIDAWTPDAPAETVVAEDTTAEATPDAEPVPTTPEATAEATEGNTDPSVTTAEEQKEQRAVPVPEYQAMRQRAQAAEAEAARLKQEQAEREAKAQAQAEDARLRAEYDRLLNEEGEDAAERFRLSVVSERQEQAQVRQRVQHEAITQRISMSEQFAIEQYGEEPYKAALGKLVSQFGDAAVFQMASQQANPAKWVWETAQAIQTPEERQAAIQAEAERIANEKLKATLSKNAPPAPRSATKGVTHLNSAADLPIEDLDPDDLSDAQLAALDRADRKKLYG